MAQIWTDQTNGMSHVFADNVTSDLIFRWSFVTFSNEQQAMAEVRWRKMDTFPSMIGRVGLRDEIWSATRAVGMFEDRTTWTIVGGQLTPPASGRRYSNITHVAFPQQYFSEGFWVFSVRFKAVGEEAGDWSGWANHKIEISEYDDRALHYGTATAFVKGPGFNSEGLYGERVVSMSQAGILSAESPEVTFNVWNTNYYTNSGGVVNATPMYYHTGNQIIRIQHNS